MVAGTFIVIILLSIIIRFIYRNKSDSQVGYGLDEDDEFGERTELKRKARPKSDLPYKEQLEKAKSFYPFDKWRENFHDYEMAQYTEENCAAAENVFNRLINDLKKVGEGGDSTIKLNFFEKAILQLNDLNNREEGLIETGEREDLCDLIDELTYACGLNPEDYADGYGIADLWRDW